LASIFSPEEFSFQPDGLAATSAEKWVRQKISIISEYLVSFCGHTAGKVDDIVFVDLCAGNGMYSIGSRKELFPSSALSALALNLPISKYVFCEEDAERAGILKIRVNKYFRGRNIVILDGHYSSLVDRLRMYVPSSKGKYKVACLCLVDTFSLDVPFETIEALGDMGFSFLMPFTFALNSQLNFEYYLVESRDRIKRFLGASTLERIEKGVGSNSQFYRLLVRAYEQKLLAMGFNVASSVHKIDSGLMEMPLYCIGLFSRQVPAKVIQSDVGAAQHTQFELFGK
jgi:three-Cys-motif partner protein